MTNSSFFFSFWLVSSRTHYSLGTWSPGLPYTEEENASLKLQPLLRCLGPSQSCYPLILHVILVIPCHCPITLHVTSLLIKKAETNVSSLQSPCKVWTRVNHKAPTTLERIWALSISAHGSENYWFCGLHNSFIFHFYSCHLNQVATMDNNSTGKEDFCT